MRIKCKTIQYESDLMERNPIGDEIRTISLFFSYSEYTAIY